jgi:hypothetical protein
LPEKSSRAAASAAGCAALRARFCAVCCRPRAFPPAFAACLRLLALAPPERLEVERDEAEPERDAERLAPERDDDEREADERDDDPDFEPALRRPPLPDPLLESAILGSSSRLPVSPAGGTNRPHTRDYRRPSDAATAA